MGSMVTGGTTTAMGGTTMRQYDGGTVTVTATGGTMTARGSGATRGTTMVTGITTTWHETIVPTARRPDQ